MPTIGSKVKVVDKFSVCFGMEGVVSSINTTYYARLKFKHLSYCVVFPFNHCDNYNADQLEVI